MWKKIKPKLIFLFPLIALIVFIISIWDGRYYFGGDLMYPINTQSSLPKSFFLWDQQNGGQSFFGYATLLWEGFFYLLGKLSFTPDSAEKILIIVMFCSGFIFTYLLYGILFKNTKFADKRLAVFAAMMFVINPAVILMPGAYPPLFAFPACYFFLIKYLDTKKLYYLIPFSLFLNFHYFTDFPQPKLLVVFSISILFQIPIYSYLRNKKMFSQYLNLLPVIIVCFLINFYVLFPALGDMFGKSGYFSSLSLPEGSYNGNADLHSAMIPYISRFYNSNIVNKTSNIGLFLGNPLFITWTYLLWFMLLSGAILLKDKKDRRLVFWLLACLSFFVFIAKGSNLPFAAIYRYLLFHFPAFKIFRTTATVSFGGLLFYIFALTITISRLLSGRKNLLYIILAIHLLILSPIAAGFHFYQQDQDRKGIALPAEYFEVGKKMDETGDNDKVLTLPLDNGYLTKAWSYFGSPIISWITKKPVIHNSIFFRNNTDKEPDTLTPDESCNFAKIYNLGYVLWEKDSVQTIIKENPQFTGTEVLDNSYFNLKKITDKCTLPVIYLADVPVYYRGSSGNMLHSLRFLPSVDKPFIIPVDDKKPDQIPDKEEQLVVEAVPQDRLFSSPDKMFQKYSLEGNRLLDFFNFPKAVVRPDSPLYSSELVQENYSENIVNFNSTQHIEKKLLTASKRISEISTWGYNPDWGNKMLENYRDKFGDAINIALKSEDVNGNLELIYDYLDKHLEKLTSMNAGDETQKVLWLKAINDLQEKTKKSYKIPDFFHFRYLVDAPLTGDYVIHIENLPSKSGYQLSYDGSRLSTSSQKKSLYLSGRKKELFLSLTDSVNLINNDKWQYMMIEKKITEPRKQIGPDKGVNGVNSDSDKKVKVVLQEISGWKPEGIYYIDINFRKNSFPLKILFLDSQKIYSPRTGSWSNTDFITGNETLKESGGELKFIVKASKNSLAGKIVLYTENEDYQKIAPVIVNEINIPEIFFTKASLLITKGESLPPEVKIYKNNPSSYALDISGLKLPSYLVFSETYNSGWQASVESDGGNNLLIPENKHILANGFSNAWYLTSDLFGGQNKIRINLTYVPQRRFYISLFISILAVLGCLIPYNVFLSKKK